MRAVAALVIGIAWGMSALAQTNNRPTQTDGTGGGILFGLFALLAAAVVGGIMIVVLKRRKRARRRS